MSLPNQIIVSGAGIAAVNGTYTRGADDHSGRARYFLDGGTQYNIIRFFTSGTFGWQIAYPPFPGASFSAAAYNSQNFGSLENVPTSPVDPSIVWSGDQAPAPIVTAAGGGGGGSPSSPAVKIENANVKIFGKTKFVV